LLRPYSLALAKDRGPDEQLITRRRTKQGNKPDRHWLLYWLGEYCEEAKVPDVCTHSLRGLYATLATEAADLARSRQRALPQLAAVTHAHYIERGAKGRATTKPLVAGARRIARGSRARPKVMPCRLRTVNERDSNPHGVTHWNLNTHDHQTSRDVAPTHDYRVADFQGHVAKMRW